MGEMADDACTHWWDRVDDTDTDVKIEYGLAGDPRERAEYWRTQHEGVVKISDMKYSHLCNTIRMLRRNWNLHRYRMSFPPFPNANGEMAQLFLEQDWEREIERRTRATSIADRPEFLGLVREHTVRLIELRRSVKRQAYWDGVRAGTEFFI